MKFPSAHRALRMVGVALCCFLVSSGAWAQVEVSGQLGAADEPAFFVDAVAFAAQSGTRMRLDVFAQVGYDGLTFVRRGDVYDASYEMTLSILDSGDGLVSEKLWTENVKGVTFERSVSSGAYSLTQRVFEVDPGRYTVRANFRDLESKATRQIAHQVLVRDLRRPDIAVSDIMVLSKVTLQGDRRSIVPNVSPNVGAIPDQFFAYFEVYQRAEADSLRYLVDVLNRKDDVVLRVDTVDVVRAGRNERILRVPHASLPMGDYRMMLRVFPRHGTPDSAGNFARAVSSKAITVRWFGLPRSVQDLDLAIEQVRYITKEDELSTLREAKTPEEKQARFFEFWKKRDPNPNTPRNEKMEEYYARVQYANKHFTHYIDGWRTDMGMIFIMFGPPNNVDRHPFELDSKPYEVWSYYDINYAFVFVDQTGFGDYRLETPLWEVWQRAPR
jgi:GWxTD domain-containing protein